MILRVNHAQITIPIGAEAEARRFYCDLLGLEEVPKPLALADRGGFWLAAGSILVHVGSEDGVDRRSTKAHLAYEVADLAACRTAIEAYGLSALDSIPIPGCDRFETRDPFGNRVEFMQVRG